MWAGWRTLLCKHICAHTKCRLEVDEDRGLSYWCGAMRTLLALVLSLCVFTHYAVAAESKTLKRSGRCSATLYTDEFTKKQCCQILGVLQKQGLWTSAFEIWPNETVLTTEGELIDQSFLRVYHELHKTSTSVDGVLIDGERQSLEGVGWQKKMVEAMKAGNQIVIRANWDGQTMTLKGSLSGFTACWNAIPKELSLEDKEVEGEEKKEAESAEKKEAPEKPKE